MSSGVPANSSYEIDDELQMSQALHARTPYWIRFEQNDQYKTDLVAYGYEEGSRSVDDRVKIGYVELERARGDGWNSGEIPTHWYSVSFLKRKIYDYDRAKREWLPCPKTGQYKNTVYLKFNHEMDNCFAAPVRAVWLDSDPSDRSDGTYKNTFRELDFDHPSIRYGVDDSFEFIAEYLADCGGIRQ